MVNQTTINLMDEYAGYVVHNATQGKGSLGVHEWLEKYKGYDMRTPPKGPVQSASPAPSLEKEDPKPEMNFWGASEKDIEQYTKDLEAWKARQKPLEGEMMEVLNKTYSRLMSKTPINLNEGSGEEKEGNLEPSSTNPDLTLVASHSSTLCNSIQQIISDKYDTFFGKGYWEEQYKKHIVIFAKQCFEMLNSEQEVHGSVATDAK